MKTEPVKHLKITEGKVFASSMEEPEHYFSENIELDKSINESNKKMFNSSFVEVENPWTFMHALYNREFHTGRTSRMLTHWKHGNGVYPALAGMQMKVKCQHNGIHNSPCFYKATISFVPSKEAEKVEDNDNPLFFKGELCDMHNRPACKPKDRVDCKCEWAAFDRLKKVEAEPTKPDFEKELNIKLNGLPFEKHVDDGQYADGVIQGWDSGARWCKDTFVTPLQEEIKKLREQLSQAVLKEKS